jgi:hypothetical protein
MGKAKESKELSNSNLSENAMKIINNMDKVWKDLLAFKRSKKSPIVVMREGRIVNLDPFTLQEIKD